IRHRARHRRDRPGTRATCLTIPLEHGGPDMAPIPPALVTPRRRRGAPRYHVDMGAPPRPPTPQRSSRPGEASRPGDAGALLDVTRLGRSGRFGEWPRAPDARHLL